MACAVLTSILVAKIAGSSPNCVFDYYQIVGRVEPWSAKRLLTGRLHKWMQIGVLWHQLSLIAAIPLRNHVDEC